MRIADNYRIEGSDRPSAPWTPTNTSTSENRYPNPLSWDRRINVRDSRLREMVIPLNYEIPMTWHHVIPLSHLKKGWNKLVEAKEWGVLAHWISALDADVTSLGWISPRSVENKMQLNFGERESLIQHFCWSPWNIVEGPSNRTDDPDDKFDNFLYILGNKYQILCSLYKQLENPVGNTIGLSQNFITLRNLRNSELRVNKQSLYFNPAAWVITEWPSDKDYPFNSMGGAHQFGHASAQHPKWAKSNRPISF